MADNTKYHCPDCGRGFYLEPQSNWHTGTPTEEGWYLFAFKVRDCDGTYFWDYEANYWYGYGQTLSHQQPIEKWQKIEELPDLY